MLAKEAHSAKPPFPGVVEGGSMLDVATGTCAAATSQERGNGKSSGAHATSRAIVAAYSAAQKTLANVTPKESPLPQLATAAAVSAAHDGYTQQPSTNAFKLTVVRMFCGFLVFVRCNAVDANDREIRRWSRCFAAFLSSVP
jgi:phage tail tape-measure protein